MGDSLVYISEESVKGLLTWPSVVHCVDQALRSVCRPSDGNPVSVQPTRSFLKLPNEDGAVLLTMPGYIGHYTSDSNSTPTSSTLACKLVTAFPANVRRSPALPSIAATILLFDTETGCPKCVLAATEITTWRTVAASLVATRCLWFSRSALPTAVRPRLAIVGCGVQGRMHAIGMVKTYQFSSVHLWNRSPGKADEVATELRGIVDDGVSVFVADTVAECVDQADIIVTATYASEPLIRADMLKKGVHINAVGAGLNHHSELADDVYAASRIYVDSMDSARIELAGLGHPIVGQIGEILLGQRVVPDDVSERFTVFHSMGMAVEDATVAEMVFTQYQR